MSKFVFAAAFAAFLAPTLVVSTTAAAQSAGATIIVPDSLKWTPLPFDGITSAVIVGNPTGTGMYALLIKFATGAKGAPHTHPDQRVVTVLSGIVHVGMGTEFDERKMTAFRPGSVLVIPADAPHYGWAKDGEVLLQEVGSAPTGTKIPPKAAAK